MKNKYEVSVLQCADLINQKKKELLEVEKQLHEIELYQRYLQLKDEVEKAEMNLEDEEERVIALLLDNNLDKVVVNGYEYKVKDTSRESVLIEDESLIPDDLFRIKKEVDKNAILNLYKNTKIITSGTKIVKNPKYKLVVKRVKENEK